MSTITQTPAAATTPAAKALAAAAKTTAATYDAIAPARAVLEAAQQALDAANAEAIEAVIVKNPDPKAARERIEKSRAAIKAAEDDVQWRVLEFHAVEAQHQEAYDAEQVARRRVVIEEVVKAHDEFNDENSRENELLRQITSGIAELVPLINDRKDRADRLASELASMPVEERPQLKGGAGSTSTRWVSDHVANLTPELLVAIRAGTAAAESALSERARVQRVG